MKKIAIVLSGCGVFDGSEIHESVAVMIALAQAGLPYQCMAANIEQTKVINHLTKEPAVEKRNILVESARIARGDIIDIKDAKIEDYSAAIYPGGFGAACNHSDFATKGAQMSVQKDVLHFAQAMAKANKPQGFVCIAPVLISKIYGPGVEQTIGCDADVAAKIKAMGGEHVSAKVNQAIVDKQHKVISTPAYMLAKNPAEVLEGAQELVKKLGALL